MRKRRTPHAADDPGQQSQVLVDAKSLPSNLEAERSCLGVVLVHISGPLIHLLLVVAVVVVLVRLITGRQVV